MAPQTSNTNSSGKAKSPRASSRAMANSSGFFLSLPTSTIVAAVQNWEERSSHPVLQYFRAWHILAVFVNAMNLFFFFSNYNAKVSHLVLTTIFYIMWLPNTVPKSFNIIIYCCPKYILWLLELSIWIINLHFELSVVTH